MGVDVDLYINTCGDNIYNQVFDSSGVLIQQWIEREFPHVSKHATSTKLVLKKEELISLRDDVAYVVKYHYKKLLLFSDSKRISSSDFEFCLIGINTFLKEFEKYENDNLEIIYEYSC